MDFQKLTQRSQEAIGRASELARRARQPGGVSGASDRSTARAGLSSFAARALRRDRCGPSSCHAGSARGRSFDSGRCHAAATDLDSALDSARRRRRGDGRARGRVRLHRTPRSRTRPRRPARGDRSPRRDPGQPTGDDTEPRRDVSGPREVRSRSDRGGRGRQARSGHRSRRRGATCDPGAESSHEEQSCLDR